MRRLRIAWHEWRAGRAYWLMMNDCPGFGPEHKRCYERHVAALAKLRSKG